ncbi:hypothetical protein GGR50DRAFT_690704 [Xylaria sp. CBS 124048]|nr:hypothetical protein GGR50DRAFT_690704 [Xylaria sp. CBS 124048]
MDINMSDYQVDFNDNFSFANQSIPSGSASGSFSSDFMASSPQGPFTPVSARSTPGIQGPLLMDHDNGIGGTSSSYGLTPPTPALNGYYTSDAKPKAAPHCINYDSILETPSRKASMQSVTINYDCAPMMLTPNASRSNSIQSTHPRSLSHGTFDDHMISPSMEFHHQQQQHQQQHQQHQQQQQHQHQHQHQHSYSVDHSAYDMMPSWPWPGDSSVNFFDVHSSPENPSLIQDLAATTRDARYQQSPYLPRRLYVDGVQQKTTALHHIQQGYHRGSKRSRPQKTTMIGEKSVVVLSKGAFRCPHEVCVDRKPFKRQEHLKRHLNTVHGDQSKINTKCAFCAKVFNRKDNWRSHLALHAREKPSRRTNYHEDAKALLDEEMRKTKQRNQPRKRSGLLKMEDD